MQGDMGVLCCSMLFISWEVSEKQKKEQEKRYEHLGAVLNSVELLISLSSQHALLGELSTFTSISEYGLFSFPEEGAFDAQKVHCPIAPRASLSPFCAHQAMLRFGGSQCEEIVSVADGQLSTLECDISRRLSFKWKMQDEIRLGQEADH